MINYELKDRVVLAQININKALILDVSRLYLVVWVGFFIAQSKI